MKKFPYDYTGRLEENKFSESRKLLSNDNSDRVIILDHAPFFPNLKVKVEGSSSPLKRGVDYELVYQVTPLEQIASDDLFCGVQILSPVTTGELHFEGNTVGGDFVDPLKDILDLLVKHLNSPLDGKWDDVDGVPALFPKKRTFRDWADLLNTHFLSGAIDNFAEKVESGSLNEQESLAMLGANVQALNLAIDEFNYPGHIADTNPHETDLNQINAHPKNLAVADTVMAYSKDFFALCDYVRQRGLSEAQLQEYLSEYLVGDVSGTFSFKDGVAIIQSEDGTAKLDMNNGRVTLSSKGSIFMQADSDVHSAGESYRFLSGGNELKIVSSGPDMSHKKIYFNGHEILNNRSIKPYQEPPSGDAEIVVYTESGTITLSGDGTEGNPIRGNLIIPNATTSTPGKARIKETIGSETSAWVAGPTLAKSFDDKLETLVPKITRINDYEMSGSGITLGKEDVNLGNVDNTPDKSKPLSDDLSAAVSQLATSNHKHEWSELAIGHATYEESGIAYIANDINNIPDNQAVSPNLLNIVKTDLESLLPRYADTLVATDLEFSSVSESTFSISGFKLTATSPIPYTISKDKAVKEGTFSGQVDLSAIDNTMWYAVENDCEQRWGKATIYTNSPTWPKPAEANYISITPNYGKAGGRVGFKKRLMFKSDSIVINISADDSYRLYIDGELIRDEGGSPVKTITHPIKPGRYCIAIEFLDGGGKGYTAFTISDGANNIIEVSDESWPAAELPVKVDPTNNRFYLYGDVGSGKIVAEAAPYTFGSVSSQYVFIGRVFTNYTQAKPNDGSVIKFETTIDYGLFKELEEHFVEEDAHGGSGQTDIVGLENVEGADVANGSTVLDIPYLIRCPKSPAWVGDYVWVSNVVTKHLSPITTSTDMFHFIEGHCPAQFHCVKNPLADNEYTVEGILHLRINGDPAITPKFLFVAEGKDDDEVLAVSPNLIAPSFEVETFGKLEPSAVGKVMPTKTSQRLSATITRPVNADLKIHPSEIGTAVAQGIADTLDDELYMLRYRYIPRTNKLTLMVSVGGSYSVFEVDFDKNMASFFNKKAVGVRTANDTIFGGVVDGIDYPNQYLKMVTNYNALFEAYLSGTDISKYAEIQNGVAVKDADRFSVPRFLGAFQDATEAMLHVSGSGEVYATHGQPLPQMFCKDHWYTYRKQTTAGIVVAQHMPDDRPERFLGPSPGTWTPDAAGSVAFRKEVNLSNDTLTVESFDDHEVSVSGNIIGSGASGEKKTYALNYNGEHIVEIRVFNRGGLCGMRASFSNGTLTNPQWRIVTYDGRGRAILYKMPWHTCQKAWDKVLAIILNH